MSTYTKTCCLRKHHTLYFCFTFSSFFQSSLSSDDLEAHLMSKPGWVRKKFHISQQDNHPPAPSHYCGWAVHVPAEGQPLIWGSLFSLLCLLAQGVALIIMSIVCSNNYEHCLPHNFPTLLNHSRIIKMFWNFPWFKNTVTLSHAYSLNNSPISPFPISEKILKRVVFVLCLWLLDNIFPWTHWASNATIEIALINVTKRCPWC